MEDNKNTIPDPNSVPRDFKGIWIPREIWLCPELSAIEKLVWAEVHSLYSRELGGCYASNEYLAKFFGMSERYIREVLSKLKSLGLMVEVSFDGRQRVIAAVEPSQDFGKNSLSGSGQTGTTVPGRPEPQFRSRRNHSSGPSYTEKKAYSKEDIPSSKVATQTANAAASPAKKNENIGWSEKNNDWQNITQKDVDSWQESYPGVDIKTELLRMREWIKANKSKSPRKSFRAFIVRWLTRSQCDAAMTASRSHQAKTQAYQKNTVDRRRRDNFGNVIPDPQTDNLWV